MEIRDTTNAVQHRILPEGDQETYDHIVQMAAYICEAPIALVTFLDEEKQYFKASKGAGGLTETPISISFCAHTAATESGQMVINDLSKDQRFTTNPFVTGAPFVKFYAGISFVNPEGKRLGTVCVLDQNPRTLSSQQIKGLDLLAKYVTQTLSLRHQNQLLKQTSEVLLSMNEQLEQFSYGVAHDIGGPLRNINNFASLLYHKAKNKLDQADLELIQYLKKAGQNLYTFTQDLLAFSQKTHINQDQLEAIDIPELVQAIDEMHNLQQEVTISCTSNPTVIHSSKAAIQQILQNIIGNSIKYRNPNQVHPFVHVEVTSSEDYYQFKIEDNGLGISDNEKNDLYKLFQRQTTNNEGWGIGLFVVQRLIQKLNGTLSIDSIPHKSTTVNFTIKKPTLAVPVQ